jgi:hypothetical protein
MSSETEPHAALFHIVLMNHTDDYRASEISGWSLTRNCPSVEPQLYGSLSSARPHPSNLFEKLFNLFYNLF